MRVETTKPRQCDRARHVRASSGESSGCASRSEAAASDSGDHVSDEDEDALEAEEEEPARRRPWCARGDWKSERSRRSGSRPLAASAAQQQHSESSAAAAGTTSHASVMSL